MFVVDLITGTGGGTPPPILQSPNYLLIAIAIATIRILAIRCSLNLSKC